MVIEKLETANRAINVAIHQVESKYKEVSQKVNSLLPFKPLTHRAELYPEN